MFNSHPFRRIHNRPAPEPLTRMLPVGTVALVTASPTGMHDHLNQAVVETTEPTGDVLANALWWKQRCVLSERDCTIQRDINRVTDDNMRSCMERVQHAEGKFHTCHVNLQFCERSMLRLQDSMREKLKLSTNETERVRVTGEDRLSVMGAMHEHERQEAEREREKQLEANNASAAEKIDRLQQDLRGVQASAAENISRLEASAAETIARLQQSAATVDHQKKALEKELRVLRVSVNKSVRDAAIQNTPAKKSVSKTTSSNPYTTTFSLVSDKAVGDKDGIIDRLNASADSDKAEIDRLTEKTTEDKIVMGRLAAQAVEQRVKIEKLTTKAVEDKTEIERLTTDVVEGRAERASQSEDFERLATAEYSQRIKIDRLAPKAVSDEAMIRRLSKKAVSDEAKIEQLTSAASDKVEIDRDPAVTGGQVAEKTLHAMREAHVNEIEQRREVDEKTHAEYMNTLRASHVTEMDALRASHAKDLRSMKERRDGKLTQMQATGFAELAAGERRYLDLVESHGKELVAQATVYEDATVVCKQSHEEELLTQAVHEKALSDVVGHNVGQLAALRESVPIDEVDLCPVLSSEAVVDDLQLSYREHLARLYSTFQRVVFTRETHWDELVVLHTSVRTFNNAWCEFESEMGEMFSGFDRHLCEMKDSMGDSGAIVMSRRLVDSTVQRINAELANPRMLSQDERDAAVGCKRQSPCALQQRVDKRMMRDRA